MDRNLLVAVTRRLVAQEECVLARARVYHSGRVYGPGPTEGRPLSAARQDCPAEEDPGRTEPFGNHRPAHEPPAGAAPPPRTKHHARPTG